MGDVCDAYQTEHVCCYAIVGACSETGSAVPCAALEALLGLLQSAGHLPEAFVVLGFAFYLQPMMMPLLHDMPPGPAGLAITSTAVKIVIIGTLCLDMR